MVRNPLTVVACVFSCVIGSGLHAAEPLKLLFSATTATSAGNAVAQLQPVLKERGIELTYSEKVEDLNAETLNKYAGLVIYANTTRHRSGARTSSPRLRCQRQGLIPLHCASYCFLNSPKYIDLVGAQFKSHQTGTFRTILGENEHPITRGFGGFEAGTRPMFTQAQRRRTARCSNSARKAAVMIQLSVEPWTWVRTHGKGHVFYTAWGHDQRTWGNPGFQNLIERGTAGRRADPGVVPAFAAVAQTTGDARTATEGGPNGADYQPQMTAKRTDVKPPEFAEAKIPFYPPNGPRRGDGEWNKMQQAADGRRVDEALCHARRL